MTCTEHRGDKVRSQDSQRTHRWEPPPPPPPPPLANAVGRGQAAGYLKLCVMATLVLCVRSMQQQCCVVRGGGREEVGMLCTWDRHVPLCVGCFVFESSWQV